MVKVKYECQDCDQEEELEADGMFLITFKREGPGSHSHTDAHHIDPDEVMRATVSWYFKEIMSAGGINFRPFTSDTNSSNFLFKTDHEQAKFQEFLKSLGFEWKGDKDGQDS